jgi:hypothetical protein
VARGLGRRCGQCTAAPSPARPHFVKIQTTPPSSGLLVRIIMCLLDRVATAFFHNRYGLRLGGGLYIHWAVRWGAVHTLCRPGQGLAPCSQACRQAAIADYSHQTTLPQPNGPSSHSIAITQGIYTTFYSKAGPYGGSRSGGGRGLRLGFGTGVTVWSGERPAMMGPRQQGSDAVPSGTTEIQWGTRGKPGPQGRTTVSIRPDMPLVPGRGPEFR